MAVPLLPRVYHESLVLLSANAIYMSEHEQRICEPSRWWLWKLPRQAGAAPQRPEVLEDFGGMIFTVLVLSLVLEGRQSLIAQPPRCPSPRPLCPLIYSCV